jgi:hypothetical protein
MNAWQSYLKDDPIPGLIEPEQPAVRYFVMIDILGPIPIDPKSQPSKWVTLRATTPLKRYHS